MMVVNFPAKALPQPMLAYIVWDHETSCVRFKSAYNKSISYKIIPNSGRLHIVGYMVSTSMC